MRYLKIFIEQFKLSFISAAIFRVNFMLMLIQSIINTVLNVACVGFLYESVDSVAGWAKNEMMILISTSLIVNQIFRAFILPNQSRFISGINSGNLDSMLLKPVNLLFQANTGNVDISSFLSLIAPVSIIINNITKSDISLNMERSFVYIVLVIISVFILTSFMLLLQSAAFLFIKVDGLMNLYYIIMSISEKPKDILSFKPLITVFTFALPAIPIAYIPASILLNKNSLRYSFISIAVLTVMGLLTIIAIKTGIKNYSSASS